MKIETAIESLKYCKEQLTIERGSDFSGVEALEMAIKTLEQAPKKGRWKDLGYNGEWYGRCYTCSVCNAEMIGAENFCPNCGSDMREENK